METLSDDVDKSDDDDDGSLSVMDVAEPVSVSCRCVSGEQEEGVVSSIPHKPVGYHQHHSGESHLLTLLLNIPR